MSATKFFELLAFLELLGRKGAPSGPPGPPGPPSPDVPPAPVPAPGVLPAVAPIPTPELPDNVLPPIPTAPSVSPGVLPPMPPWPGTAPATLPPFPGPGWVPDLPVTGAIAARAAYWNPQLWDYPSKSQRRPYVQEQYGGQWLTFAAAWHPGDQGPRTYMATEAWRLASAPAPSPSLVIPPTPVMPAPAAPIGPPTLIGPYPGPNAWATNTQYIAKIQNALAWLSNLRTQPAWNPGAVDGKNGPHTQAAVRAYQQDHALTADGMAGPQTAASIDAELSGGAPPSPAAPPPAPAPMPGAAPSAPAPIGPYPGPGAYARNAAYIRRYQAVLAYLAATQGVPAWDPGGIDGKFGAHTQAAVRAFQASHALTADGQAGQATAAALDSQLASSAPS